MVMEIPAAIRSLMWEYSIDDRSFEDSWERAVIERTMERGGWNEMRWLLRAVGTQRLRSFLEDRGRNVLPPRELRFWSIICGVSASAQDEWVEEARQRRAAWLG
jgi:hypothetical protein